MWREWVEGRKKWLGSYYWGTRNAEEASLFRGPLIEKYGPEKGKAITNCEAFELCVRSADLAVFNRIVAVFDTYDVFESACERQSKTSVQSRCD